MMHGRAVCAVLAAAVTLAAAFHMPMVPLGNAAHPGLLMPAMGLGTFGYGVLESNGTETNGEVWNDTMAEPLVVDWIKMGGRRIDGAFNYKTQYGVGKGIKDSGIDRNELFLTSKIDIGGNISMYNYTMQQFQGIQEQFQTDVVDLLLIHWPGNPHLPPSKSGYFCASETSYKTCRTEAWRALSDLFKQGKARAIGVSNFERQHIEDLLEMKGLVPSINQVEFHPYWNEPELVEYCKGLGIHYQSYSPLGAPDHMSFHRDQWPEMPAEHAALKPMADKYHKTPSQLILMWAWQQGVSLNPRTRSTAHMEENLNLFDFALSGPEMEVISNLIKSPESPSTQCNNTAMTCPNKVCPPPGYIP